MPTRSRPTRAERALYRQRRHRRAARARWLALAVVAGAVAAAGGFTGTRQLVESSRSGGLAGSGVLADPAGRPAPPATPRPPANVVFPPDSRVVNVRAAPYNARGDGVHDDTGAIVAALGARRSTHQLPVYLPAGTYLVSERVLFPAPGTVLQGQGRDRTVIRLRDRAPGFGNPKAPRAVVDTYEGGQTGSWHWNSVFDLSIDVGRGNPGAIGLRFLSNNTGGVRNVRIRSSDPGRAGHTGLAMTQAWVGPAMVRNLLVDGFERGIETAGTEYSLTFEQVGLARQRAVGLANYANILSIRGLRSDNAVPAVENRSWNNGELNWGMITLVDADLRGGAPSQVAVVNQAAKYAKGYLYARNLRTSGYRAAIANEGRVLPGAGVAEYVSSPRLSLFPVERRSLGLPVADTPELPWDPPAAWANVERHGARANDGGRDDTRGIQAAIDSGATTVYLPHGRYFVSGTIHVRGNVRRIIGLESQLEQVGQLAANPALPTFRFDEGAARAVVLERFTGLGRVQHNAARTLVIRNTGMDRYWNTGQGSLFLEDVASGELRFDRQQVWARQLNPETDGTTEVVNSGGTLWVLGIKTEYAGSVLENRAGARTEILGGLIYSTSPRPPGEPAFVNTDSSLSVVAGESAYSDPASFQVLVRETRGSEARTLAKQAASARVGFGRGFVLPLYRG